MIRLSKRLCLALTLLATLPGAAFAQSGPKAGFDFYVLALSWAPAWCELEGDERGADACDPAADADFTLHGLWPQYEEGWPSYCRTSARDPSRRETAAMADLFGSSGAAWYQWKKHGRCSGLDPADYYEQAREAMDIVRAPEVLKRITKPLEVAPDVVEAAFQEENPELDPDEILITCRQGLILEARICMTKSLTFRDCGETLRSACKRQTANILPIR